MLQQPRTSALHDPHKPRVSKVCRVQLVSLKKEIMKIRHDAANYC